MHNIKRFLANFLFLMMAYLSLYGRSKSKSWIWLHCTIPCLVFAWKMLEFDTLNWHGRRDNCVKPKVQSQKELDSADWEKKLDEAH